MTNFRRAAWAVVPGILLGAILAPPTARAQVRPTGLVAGVGAGVAMPVGQESAGVSPGYALHPRVGYGLAYGLTPNLAVSYSRWSADAGQRWELSVLPGLRWNLLQGKRLQPWIEGALGYGQLVHDNANARGRVDIGFRVRPAAGLDLPLSDHVLLGVQVAFNQLYGGGSPSYVSTWIDMGVGVTLQGW
jgi:hypothetical protein